MTNPTNHPDPAREAVASAINTVLHAELKAEGGALAWHMARGLSLKLADAALSATPAPVAGGRAEQIRAVAEIIANHAEPDGLGDWCGYADAAREIIAALATSSASPEPASSPAGGASASVEAVAVKLNAVLMDALSENPQLQYHMARGISLTLARSLASLPPPAPVGDDPLAKLAAEMVPLGSDFAAAFEENARELYEATPSLAVGDVRRTGAEMIARHRFCLHEDGNCAEIDSDGLAEEIDAALSPEAKERP